MDPLKILRDAIAAVPAVKYALGIAGIAAVVAIVLGLRLSPQVAVFGTLVVLGLMFILVVFSKYAGQASVAGFLGPAKLLVWFYTLAVIVATILFMTSYFLHRPLDFRPDVKPVLPPSSTGVSGFHQFGNDSFKEGYNNDARAGYEAAFCIDPEDSEAKAKSKDVPPTNGQYVYSLRKVGEMLMDNKQFRCAENLFREALEYDPPDPAQTHYLLGIALKEQGRINEALNEFTQAEQLLNALRPEPTCSPSSIYTWVGYLHQERGWALRSKALQTEGPYDAALDEFKKARPCIMSTDWVPTNIDEVKTGTRQAGH